MNRAKLAALGVKRISIGSGLSRAALSAFLRAASEMREHGTFTFAENTLMLSEIGAMFPE
jgi:2-methylisocitrate lyase-like PEP mutase family enzyme